jgi:hypothetical protein
MWRRAGGWRSEWRGGVDLFVMCLGLRGAGSAGHIAPAFTARRRRSVRRAAEERLIRTGRRQPDADTRAARIGFSELMRGNSVSDPLGTNARFMGAHRTTGDRAPHHEPILQSPPTAGLAASRIVSATQQPNVRLGSSGRPCDGITIDHETPS